MILIRQRFKGEADYQRMGNFLRDCYLANGRQEHSWHVACLDHWRWHYLATCRLLPTMEDAVTLWETRNGRLAAFIVATCHDEIAIQVHPDFRSRDLENDMICYAEERYSDVSRSGKGRILYVPHFSDDLLRKKILLERGYSMGHTRESHWQWTMGDPVPVCVVSPGFSIRHMQGEEDHSARSWCSWRTFHPDELDDAYDGDSHWYCNMESAPLYRPELDLVAESANGELAAFCTISFDPATSSAYCVLTGVIPEYRHLGLGEALLAEGLRRLQLLGCQQLFGLATDEGENQIYRSIMTTMRTAEVWVRDGFSFGADAEGMAGELYH